MGPREKQRPGPGPIPVAVLKRMLTLPGPLQPVRVAAAGGAGGGHGPFIFNPNAEKKARAAAEHQTLEWVSCLVGLVSHGVGFLWFKCYMELWSDQGGVRWSLADLSCYAVYTEAC